MIQEYIEKSLKSESLIQYLERKIMDTLILKQNFYNILKNSCQELIDDLDFNKQLYSLCEQVYEVNKILKFNFQNTPNQKIHGLYTFFIGEILSNYYKSVQFYKNSKCLEVELNKFQQIINFNINQKNVHYTILELCDDMQNLNLIGHSQNFHDNFGTCQKKQKLFEHLLPDCLIPYHNLYVKRFFETGTSKYFNIFQINFIMSNTQNILTTVNMCYSVTNLFKSKNMIFAVFLQESTQDKAYLFVDGNNLKCKFTKNLMIQIGWSIPDIEDQIKIKEILQVEILQIYPDFLNVIENKENEIKLNQITMYFPSLSNYLDQIENKSKQSPDRGRQNLRYIAVVCDILIQRREIGDFCYYLLDIVKMAELIKIRKKTTIHKVELLKQIKQNKYQNDEEYIVYQQDDSPNIGNLNSVNFINQQQIGSIQNSTKPLVLQVNPMFVSNSPVLNSRREDTINQTEQQLITQKLSLLKEDLGSPSLQSNDDEEKSQKSKGIQLQETQTETDKIQLKYSLINQIISASTTRYQKNFMVLFSIWFSIFITFIIVLQIELNNDLEDFLSYGFMTSFYASIMGPHDLYFSMRVALTTYQQMNREGFLPSSQMKQFIAPIQEIVDLGYIELRDSFYDQLNNPYIQNFLNDAKVIMNFMNKNEQEVYPIEVSFRDALFTILQYQYAAMRTLQRGESNSGKPFQVSVFANQFMLHKECEKLTQSLYDYAIYMHSNMIQKLITLWLIFDIALIIFYIYLQNFQIKFFSQLDKFVSLIFLIDNPILNKEVIRYNNLMTSIKLNSDLLLNYNPEVQLQQHFNKPLQSHDNQNQNQKQKQSLQAIIKSRSLIKILNISFLIFLLSIILIFSLIIITSTSLFFSKYDDTLQFYQQVQQMKFRPGNLILYREIFFRWQNFTFLTQNNKVELYDLINKAQNSIYNYILTSNSINYDLYLIDSNFIDLFEDINKNNLCNFIDEKFKNSSQIYCQFSFDGSFSNGMISALNYITNYIKSQQAINNFTRRVEIQYYEAEGSQIVSRVFSNLVNQFNSSLKLQFDGMKLFLTVLSFSFIITTIVIQILLFYFYSPYLGRIMKIIKRVVYLIPFESLMKNELLVRQLKELKFKFQ
ncbi:unnamed protein product [Paramecium sonneborni]|uniref:Transmembrane protein n=1 Tax=Paramecium sonneborni TaxID=65129 RepID=A0A8S1M3Q7_9CILI|nr:unnamed protein product [Paramecium sonneborni]